MRTPPHGRAHSFAEPTHRAYLQLYLRILLLLYAHTQRFCARFVIIIIIILSVSDCHRAILMIISYHLYAYTYLPAAVRARRIYICVTTRCWRTLYPAPCLASHYTVFSFLNEEKKQSLIPAAVAAATHLDFIDGYTQLYAIVFFRF